MTVMKSKGKQTIISIPVKRTLKARLLKMADADNKRPLAAFIRIHLERIASGQPSGNGVSA